MNETKGRVTPKRSQAQAARRKQMKGGTPKTRKEATARRRAILAETRESLKSTDISKLPANERVPELIYTRDLVDTRRNLGGAMLWVIGVYFVSSTALAKAAPAFATPIFLLTLLWFLGIMTDCVILGRKVQTKVRERYPSSTFPVRWYAARRALAPKRFRRPVVRVTKTDDPWRIRSS